MTSMDSRTVIRRREENGWYLDRINGSHHISDALGHPDRADAVALIVVEALPERELSSASDKYRGVHSKPVSAV